MAEGSNQGREGPWFHEQVERLVAEGKTYKAVRQLESRLETEDPVQIVKAAFALSEAGHGQVARRTMEAVVRRYPRLWLAHRALGRLCFQHEDFPTAVDSFTKAARLRPEPIALTLLGHSQSCLGNTEEAKAAYRRALEIDPEYEEAAYSLATLLVDCDPVEAKSLFRAAIQVDPEYGIAHRELGVLLRKQGGKRLAEAEKHLRRAVELLPNDPWSRMHLGNCLWQRGSVMQAYDTFKQAAQIAPDLSAPLWAMADIEHARGNREEAIALTQRALKIDPEDPSALSNMGAYMIDSHNMASAREYLERALVSDPRSKRARKLLEMVDAADGDR